MSEVMTADEFTISESFLDVGNGSKLYVHDWGNKKTQTPIIYLHGGPGGWVNNKNRQFFNPQKQRVIFFDQRGSGQSKPLGELKNNTTADLVEDIEKIATKYKLGEFMLTGGSWGSCLALAYGIKYPHRVKAMVLRGIFTGSEEEIRWIDEGRFKTFFPDVWERYLAETPAKYRDNPSKYHFKQALGRSKQAKKSAYAYENLEFALLSLDDRYMAEDFKTYKPGGIKIEIQYLFNRCFMPERYILDNAHKLTMPIWLVQGRYDMVCPPKSAYELNKRLPKGELVWAVAGHASGERPIYDLMRAILQQLTNG